MTGSSTPRYKTMPSPPSSSASSSTTSLDAVAVAPSITVPVSSATSLPPTSIVSPPTTTATGAKAAAHAVNASAAGGGTDFLHSIAFKLIILIWYAIQNTVHILLMSYTRTRNVKEVYYPEVAAFMTELLKVTICLFVVFWLEASFNPVRMFRMLRDQLFRWGTFRIGLPAFLYTIQNVILYYAASHLSATAFMITLQLKLMSAAIFSVILLRRRLSALHWLALFALFAGVSIVQVTSAKHKHHTAAVGQQIPMLGFGLTVIGCLTSGFSGVYLEKIYKKSSPISIWMRNVQMSLFMIPFSAAFVAAKNTHKIIETRFFYGFDWVVWLLIFWLSIGGLTVGICIKYADNITKDMATSMAIILATVASVFMFHFKVSWLFGLGASLVIAAIFLYSYSNRIVDAIKSAKRFNGVMTQRPKRSKKEFLHRIEQSAAAGDAQAVAIQRRKQKRTKVLRLSAIDALRHLQVRIGAKKASDKVAVDKAENDAQKIGDEFSPIDINASVIAATNTAPPQNVLESGGVKYENVGSARIDSVRSSSKKQHRRQGSIVAVTQPLRIFVLGSTSDPSSVAVAVDEEEQEDVFDDDDERAIIAAASCAANGITTGEMPSEALSSSASSDEESLGSGQTAEIEVRTATTGSSSSSLAVEVVDELDDVVGGMMEEIDLNECVGGDDEHQHNIFLASCRSLHRSSELSDQPPPAAKNNS